MQKDYNTILKRLERVDVPDQLSGRILARIDSLERRAVRLRLGLFSFSALSSFIAMILSLQYSWSGLAQSGFPQYLSLITSDGTIALTYWKEFALTLIESLPLQNITILLFTLFALLYSLKFAVYYLRIAFIHQPKFA